ncbi:MAG: permease-like cell division protein FtsX [Gemmatimonadaceae bacterium]
MRDIESRVEIRAFIADGTSVDDVGRAMDIANYKEVERVEYVSPDQALVQARRGLGEFKDVFDASFLPGSIDLDCAKDRGIQPP